MCLFVLLLLYIHKAKTCGEITVHQDSLHRGLYAKNMHCSTKLITLWIAQFMRALCAAAPGTNTWHKGNPFLAIKVSRLQGGGVAPQVADT